MAIQTIDTYALGLRIETKNAFQSVKKLKSKVENLKITAPKIGKVDSRQFSKVKSELKQSAFHADSLNRKIKRSAISTQRLGRGIVGVGKKLQGIQLPSTAIFAGGGLALNKAADDASNLAESINAVNVIFGDSKQTILDFGKTAANTVGLSQRQFNELAVPLSAQLRNAGMEGEELNKTLISIVKRAADVGSVNNLDIDKVLEKFSSALRGEANPIETLGVIVNAAAVEQEALSKGVGKSVKKLTEQEKIALRLGIILKQTDKTQGDFSNTSEELANKIRITRSEFENLSAELGREVLPVKLAIVKVISKVIKSFSGLSDENKELVVKIGLAVVAIAGIGAVLAPVVIGVGATVVAFGKFAFAISAVAKVAAAFKVVKVVSSLAKVVGLLAVLKKGFVAFRVLLAANPLGLLVTAAILIASKWESIIKLFGRVYKAIKKVFSLKAPDGLDLSGRRANRGAKRLSAATQTPSNLTQAAPQQLSNTTTIINNRERVVDRRGRPISQNNRIEQHFHGTVDRNSVSSGTRDGLAATYGDLQ